MKKWMLMAISLVMIIGVGCSDKKQTFFEDTGEKMDKGVHDAGEAMDKGMHDAGKKVEDVTK